MRWKSLTAIAFGLIATACGQEKGRSHPTESYVRPPKAPVTPSDHVFGRDHMVHFYDAPGEYGYVLEGRDYGFEALSIITTDTHPGGGPPLHTHDTEEAHVLQEGHYRALIGERQIDVVGPAVVRIPPGVPHTFVNTSDRVIHVVGVLSGDTVTYTELGSNPLLEELEDSGRSRPRPTGSP